MFAIEEAKLPPPTPASAARTSRVPKPRSGRVTAQASARGREQEHERRDDGPVAAAEERHREGVGQAQGGAAPYNEHVAQAWQAFYDSPPHRVANLVMAAVGFLVAAAHPTLAKETA